MTSVYFDLLAEEEKYRLNEQSALLSALLSNPSRGKLSILRRAGLALTGLEVNGKSSGVGGRIVIDFGNPIGSNESSGSGFKAGEMVKIIVNGKLLDCTGTVERRRRGALKDIAVSLCGDIETDEMETLMSSSHPRIALIKIVDEVGMFERMKENLKGLSGEGNDSSDLVAELRDFINGNNNNNNCIVNKNKNTTTDTTDTADTAATATTTATTPSKLNSEQEMAVGMSLEMVKSNEINLMTIHGPPGTGKTSVLVEIIRRLMASKTAIRILICGPSNLSVDNIIERLDVPTKITSKLLRIGHSSRVLESCQRHTLDFWSENCDEGKLLKDVQNEIENLEKNQLTKCKNWAEKREIYGELRLLRQERRKRERSLQGDLISKAEIVACTLSTGGGKRLKGQKFDLAVVDEAGQSLLPEMLIAPLLARKLLLVGDHFQLPPTVMNPEIKQKLEVSLFEKLVRSENVKRVMLKEQYRMNELIMKWSNGKFYGNELRAHESVRSWSLDGADVLIFYDTCGFDLWESVESEKEKESKVKLIEGTRGYYNLLLTHTVLFCSVLFCSVLFCS